MNPTGFESLNLDTRDVAVIKRNSEVTPRKQTTLYFVGVELVQSLKGTSRPVFVKGQPFHLPALGESITVDEVIAKDLIDKTRWSPDRGKDAKARDIFIREEHGGKQMAEMLKKAIAEGTPLGELNLYGVQKQSIAEKLSDDELLEMLKARGLDTTVSEVEPEKPSKPAKVNKAVPDKK